MIRCWGPEGGRGNTTYGAHIEKAPRHILPQPVEKGRRFQDVSSHLNFSPRAGQSERLDEDRVAPSPELHVVRASLGSGEVR